MSLKKRELQRKFPSQTKHAFANKAANIKFKLIEKKKKKKNSNTNLTIENEKKK